VPLKLILIQKPALYISVNILYQNAAIDKDTEKNRKQGHSQALLFQRHRQFI
jgi:hypothetical protein